MRKSKKKILSDEDLLMLAAENSKKEIINLKSKSEPKKSESENISEKEVSTSSNISSSKNHPKNNKIEVKHLTNYTLPQSKALSIHQKKNKYLNELLKKVENFLINEMLIDSSTKIIVAVSGGVDSVTLLDALAVFADKYKFQLFVAHFNHNLRAENSNRDAEFVKKLAKEYALPFHTANGKVKKFSEKNSISIETAARILRYNFFERISRSLNADFVATAHTANDSVETFFINLFRGSGLTGLCGIPLRRQFIKDVLLVRPLIDLKKNELIEYAKIRNLQWNEDETNSLLNFTRNKIRLDLIPKLENEFNPAIIDVINRTTKLLQGADRIIHQYVKRNLPLIVENVSNDSFAFNISIFQTFDKFIQGELIQTAFLKYFRQPPPNLSKIDRILQLVNSETGSMFEITKSISVAKDRNLLVFYRRKVFQEINLIINKVGSYKINGKTIILNEVPKKDVKISNNPNIEYLDFDLVPSVLYIRNWKSGDTFQPLGMENQVKVSDFLTNQKISFLERPNVLVLCSKNDIIWLIGKRINDKFKITENTKKILKLEIIGE